MSDIITKPNPFGSEPAPLPTASEAFGTAPLPTAAEAFGPVMPQGFPASGPEMGPNVYGPDLDEVFTATPAGKVLDAFGQGFKQGWGSGPLGLDKDTEDWLRRAGIFNDVKDSREQLSRSFNEQMVRPSLLGMLEAGARDVAEDITRPSAKVLDFLFNRAPTALYHGFGDVALQLGVPSDIVALPEAFPAGRETGFPTRPAVPPEIARASDLGVIGKGEAGYQGLPTADELAAQKEAVSRLSPDNAPTVARPVSPQPFGPEQTAQRVYAEPPGPEAPDLHGIARQIEPDLFNEYDTLSARKDTLRGFLDDLSAQRERGSSPDIAKLDEQIDTLREQRLTAPPSDRAGMANQITALEDQRAGLADALPKVGDTPEMARVRRDLQETDYRMRDLAPDVSAAYRRAAAGEAPPEAPPAAEPVAEPTVPEAASVAAEPAPVAEPAAAIATQPETPEAAPAPPEAAFEPPVPPGTVRFYHGGGDYSGGSRWLTEDRAYAEGYAAKTPGAKAFYVDVPETWLEDHGIGKQFDDTGTDQRAPYVHFDAPEEIASKLKPLAGSAPSEVASATPAPQARPASPPLEGSIAGDVAKQLVAAGRPAEDAEATGAIVQARYEARSANLKDTTPEQLYREDAPRIIRARQRAPAKADANEMAQPRRGSYRPSDPATNAQATIKIFRDADASTAIHEFGHDWLEQMNRDAVDPRATDQVRTDAQTIHDYLGTEQGQPIPRRAHEKFARSFERYMMEGHAPSAGLARVFQQFKQWLTDIYERVAKLRAPINDDIRAVFDRMLATPGQEPVIAPERPVRSFANIHEADAEHVPAPEAADAAETVRSERDRITEAAAPEIQDERLGGVPPTEDGGGAAGSGVPGQVRPTGRDNAVPAGERNRPGAQREGGNKTAAQGDRASQRSGTAGGGRSEPPTSPNAPFGPTDERLIDKAGNIRLDNLNTPEDVDATIRATAESNNGFIDERRGVISDGQMLDLADALGMDPAFLDAKKIGQAFSAEEVLAARKLLVQSATAVRDAMGKAAFGGEVELAELAQAITKHEMIQAKVAQATAEWGRAGRAFRNLEGWGQAKDLNQFLKQNTGRDLNQLMQMARLGQKLQTPGQVSKLVADTRFGKVRQAIIYYWVNTLISGPITHMTYSVGNAVNALFTPLVETPLAAASGAAREAMGIGGAERVYLREASSQLYGLGKGFRDGLGAAVEAYKTGVSPPLPGERLSAQFSTPQASPIPGVAGRVIGVPGKSVAAIHSFFKSIRYEQNIQALAMRDALSKGLDGNARDLHVAQLTKTPPPEMMDAAVSDALKELYMRPAAYDSFEATLTRAANKTLVTKIIAPFMKIGSEIVRNAFTERTPLGLANREVRGNLLMREGGADFDTQLGKVMAGTGLMGAIALGVIEGNVTGDGPSDPDERRVWLLTHKPNHITVGPLTFSYARLGHLAMLARFASNMTETASRWDDEDGMKLARGFFDGISRSVLDETWMRGVKDVFDAIYHPEENFEPWVTRFVAQWEPFSIGQGQIARMIDPYQRETRDLSTLNEIFNQIKAQTPLWSQTLPARRDVFGEPIMAGSGTVDRYANDHVAQALDALHMGLAMPERKIRNVPLTPQQYDDYARISGRMAKMELDAMISPVFRSQPMDIQIKAIKNVVDRWRESTASMIQMQSSRGENDIIRKASDAKAAALQGAKPVEVKEILKAH